MILFNLTATELLPKVGKILLELADHMTDPPGEEWDGVFRTSVGNEFDIRMIPDGVPYEFCFTLWVPGQERPTAFIRKAKFSDLEAMARLVAHEGRHVDRWYRLGIPKFIAEWATNEGRLDLEAEGYAENVNWRMKNDPFYPVIEGMDKLDFWTMRTAKLIDRRYHIRGHGMEECYGALRKYVISNTEYGPQEWKAVQKWKPYFLRGGLYEVPE